MAFDELAEDKLTRALQALKDQDDDDESWVGELPEHSEIAEGDEASTIATGIATRKR